MTETSPTDFAECGLPTASPAFSLLLDGALRRIDLARGCLQHRLRRLRCALLERAGGRLRTRSRAGTSRGQRRPAAVAVGCGFGAGAPRR